EAFKELTGNRGPVRRQRHPRPHDRIEWRTAPRKPKKGGFQLFEEVRFAQRIIDQAFVNLGGPRDDPKVRISKRREEGCLGSNDAELNKQMRRDEAATNVAVGEQRRSEPHGRGRVRERASPEREIGGGRVAAFYRRLTGVSTN